MDRIEQVVHQVLLRVARQRSPSVLSVNKDQRLTAELGLKSLDIARVIALLELELHADPFAQLVPITEIRTVADLCAAYHKALGPPEAGPPPTFAPSLDRAEARRSAHEGKRP